MKFVVPELFIVPKGLYYNEMKLCSSVQKDVLPCRTVRELFVSLTPTWFKQF